MGAVTKYLLILSFFLFLCSPASAINMMYVNSVGFNEPLATLVTDLTTIKSLGIDTVMPYVNPCGTDSPWQTDADFAAMLNNTLLPAAASAGVGILVDVIGYTHGDLFSCSTPGGGWPNTVGLTYLVNQIKNTPGLAGYYTADEPSVYGYGTSVQSVHDTIVALDTNPAHQIVYVQFSPVQISGLGQLPYVTTDHTIYGADDYPLKKWTASTYYYPNDIVFPTTGRQNTGYAYKAVTLTGPYAPGEAQSGSTEPTWPTCTPGCTTACQVQDNYILWRCTGSGVPGSSLITYSNQQANSTTDTATINSAGGTSDKIFAVIQAFGGAYGGSDTGFTLPLSQELIDQATAIRTGGTGRNGIAFFTWTWIGGGTDIKSNPSWWPAIRQITMPTPLRSGAIINGGRYN